jgi:lambda repressor-like predicted transcriptional regulator
MSRNQLIIDKLLSTMLGNRGITIRELCDEVGLSFGSVHSVLTRFGRETRLSEICHKMLTVQQKETRLAVARDCKYFKSEQVVCRPR